MEDVLVYSAADSPRLRYVLDWILRERLHLTYRITDNDYEATHAPVVISYGKAFPKSISIPDAGLLWQTGTTEVSVDTGTWQNEPTLFASHKKLFTLPFDMFSGVFWLLSRYEEYQPYKADKHGRYPARSSLMYRKGCLQRPLADEWVAELRRTLQRSGAEVKPTTFVYQPTYDIDIAYSHLYKGATRIAGAYLRALLRMDVKQLKERTEVLKSKQKDPYDSFRWLRQLHSAYGYKPVYFVLAAEKTTLFDKNIKLQHPAMMRVVRNLAKEGVVGMHPSYYSDKVSVLANEQEQMAKAAEQQITQSRQHYIKVKLPDTYRLLLQRSITDDHSMGYGSHFGFRAGTGASFIWYDLLKEEVTSLRVHPFCFMDTTAHYEQKMNVQDAFTRLHAMAQVLEQSGSVLVTVFHNFSLGTAREWKGWRHAYESFLQEQAIHGRAD
jgi:hypothetical protein